MWLTTEEEPSMALTRPGSVSVCPSCTPNFEPFFGLVAYLRVLSPQTTERPKSPFVGLHLLLISIYAEFSI